MQVSIKWLKDYIDFDETPEQLADLLTMAGVPVENVVRADAGLDKVVTGRLAEVVRVQWPVQGRVPGSDART